MQTLTQHIIRYTTRNFWHTADMNTLKSPKKFSGKWFSPDDMARINEMIATSPNSNRTALSRMVCEEFSWYKINGGLKDMSCRVAMLRMERDDLIKLPPSRGNQNLRKNIGVVQKTQATEAQPILAQALKNLAPIRLELVTRSTTKLWNEYIDRYHYLGYKPLPGAQLRYFVYSGDRVLALLGFGAAAWKTAPRDQYIGWDRDVRHQYLHLIVNNARFLILPWIKVPHLGSKVLSMVAKRLPTDWQARYHYRPLLLETFVEVARFAGTCYHAANWIRLGETQGRGKKGGYLADLPIKSVWVYPLDKDSQRKLCEAANPPD